VCSVCVHSPQEKGTLLCTRFLPHIKILQDSATDRVPARQTTEPQARHPSTKERLKIFVSFIPLFYKNVIVPCACKPSARRHSSLGWHEFHTRCAAASFERATRSPPHASGFKRPFGTPSGTTSVRGGRGVSVRSNSKSRVNHTTVIRLLLDSLHITVHTVTDTIQVLRDSSLRKL